MTQFNSSMFYSTNDFEYSLNNLTPLKSGLFEIQ